MKLNRALTLTTLVTGFLLTGYFGFDSASDTIFGRYKVLWIDLREQQFICETSAKYPGSCSLLVPEYGFAVGHDKNFILTKQHHTVGFEGYSPSTF